MPIKFRNTPVSEPLTFASVGNHWNQEPISRPNGHPLYHYLQTEKGCGRVSIQGKNYILNEGEGVLIAPFIPHAYCPEREEWFTLFFTFTGLIEDSIMKILGNRKVIFTGKEQGAQIRAQMSGIMDNFGAVPPDTRQISVACYAMLLYFVDGVYACELLEDSLYKRYIEPVIKEIETNYEGELTVCRLSGLVYVTPQYLTRLFRRFLGCSVYEYLTTYRINKAKELLLTQVHWKVQDISSRVGFSDTSHFIAVFKRMTGMTPLEFRKNY